MTQNVTARDLLEQVARYCAQHRFFQDEQVLVALSGGGDSVALLDMLLQLCNEFGITICAVHVNHGIREKSAEQDEQFCRELCNLRNVPLTVERIPSGVLAGRNDSLETAARDERQRILAETAQEIGATKIATGHTLSDQAETILQRITRGTGPAGLSGILPIRDNFWIRPLLCIDRKTVRTYLAERALEYRDDESNDDPAFTRNRIRNRLMPLLRDEFSPAIEHTIARLADISRTQEQWIQSQMEQAFNDCLRYRSEGKILLDKRVVLGYHTMIQQRLIRHCRLLLEGPGHDDDARTNELVRTLFEKPDGKHTITTALTCEVYEKNIVFTGATATYGPIPITVPGDTLLPDGHGTITATHNQLLPGERNVPEVSIPSRFISEYGPLNVGSVRTGETISLSSHRSPVKIRALYSTASLPTALRTALPVIRAGAVALWIPSVAKAGDIARKPGVSPEDSGAITITYRDGITWQR